MAIGRRRTGAAAAGHRALSHRISAGKCKARPKVLAAICAYLRVFADISACLRLFAGWGEIFGQQGEALTQRGGIIFTTLRHGRNGETACRAGTKN